jgi:hypothetical protein
MAILRTDIERALDELIADEEGMRFQALAVVLAKQKWPDLIASERHKDNGLDAYAPASIAQDRKGKGLACSITPTLTKIKDDAAKAKKNFPDVEILIFATPQQVTNAKIQPWADEIRREFDYELIVVPREDIITSLMLPANAALCGTLPGIQVSLDKDDIDLLANVREAVAQEARQWLTRLRTVNRPIVSLDAVKLDRAGKETSETFNIDRLRLSLLQSQRIALEAPGGGGKTTTLAQLAVENPREGELAFLVDLPAWIRSGADILDFIARAPAFRARNITASDLARLANSKHYSFLLNGWNEIAEVHSNDAVVALSELERNFPAAGIIVATRTHYITPPLPGAVRVKLLSFNRWQRADYLRQTLGNRSDDLRLQLEGSRALDALTRTPLILAEVVTIFESGGPIPSTRIDVLGEVTALIESSDEHRPHLQATPLFNGAQHYLRELAAQMTARNEVDILEEYARSIIQSTTAELLRKNQIATAPDPATLLHALCAHHTLEQIDYPSVSFRFQHQQFQEFYAARFSATALAKLVESGNDAADRAFAASYINKPMWGEPLRMVAEEIQLRSKADATKKEALDVGVRLVSLALEVDPIFASDLSRLCGPVIWSAVQTKVGKVLRDWYAIGEVHHRQCALAAMLATGADDFTDILIPLLTNEDREVRISTYEAGDAFYPSSLGSDWRRIVEGWDEDSRADFVYEVAHRSWMIEIAESFAMRDPSEKVRAQAIEGLSWIGATEVLTRVLNSLDDSTLEAALPALIPETTPAVLRERLVSANRRLLAGQTKPLDRIRCLLQCVLFGDSDTATDLVTELNNLSPPLDQHAEHAIREALRIVNKQDENWVSTWVGSRLLNGTLWGEQWQSFLAPVLPQNAAGLIDKLATQEVPIREASSIRAVVSASATQALAAKIFTKFCEVQRVTSAGGASPLAWKCRDQLRTLLLDLPIEIAAAGMIECVSGQFSAESFQAVADVLGSINSDPPDLRSTLPDALRQILRNYLKRGVSALLTADLFSDDTRAHAAIALARVGEADDLVDLRKLIDADIQRQKTRSNATTYSNWFVQALLKLGTSNADTVLIDLLQEQKYEGQAVGGLLQRLVPPNQEKPWLSNTTDYEAIWRARAGMRPPDFDVERAGYYAQAIKQRISELTGERARAAEPERVTGRLKSLAFALAKLDGRDNADLILEIMALPGRWDGFVRMNTMKALLQSGVMPTLESLLAVLNPTIEHLLSQGMYNDQNLTLLVDCLELILFSADPSSAIARIKEVMSRFRYRPYQFRDLVVALGHTRSEAAVGFLLDLARGTGGLQNIEDAWIEALGRLNVPESRQIFLSYIDPEIPWVGVNMSFDYRNAGRFAAYIAKWAHQDLVLMQRLLTLSAGSLTPTQKILLSAIYRELGSEDAMLAGVNLLQGTMSSYGVDRGLEMLFLERHPHDGSGAFFLVPRNAEQVRAKLFQMVLNDPSRRKAAFAILGQVEVWRIEHGRPQSEPRHPMIESGEPWPPLSRMNEREG